MNVVEYNYNLSNKIAFCFIDNTNCIQDNFCKEIIKNQSDYTLSNVLTKKYDVYQSLNEDIVLQHVANLDYTHALVFSTGSEFINGREFFNSLENLVKDDFFIYGHVLDRGTAYYELHHQCYLINLEMYRKLNCPLIGQMELGASHAQAIPVRSLNNIHDTYTPTWVRSGHQVKVYDHKCHGWNILSLAFYHNLPVKVFDNNIRNNKKHLYPESKKDFLQNLNWIYFREKYASVEFIHKENTEANNSNIDKKFTQLIIPASGSLYTDLIDEGRIIIYDYNDNALNYWKNNIQRKSNITYEFVKADLLLENNLINYIDVEHNSTTLINLSNIFCYEGTACLSPLYYRVYKENEIINALKEKVPECTINFNIRAAGGFIENLKTSGISKDFEITDIGTLKKPSWHYNLDWV